MKNYLEIVENTLKGEPKTPYRNREQQTVTDTVGIFAAIFRHDMREGFPLLTTKKMSLNQVAIELEAFINGITDKKWFEDRGSKIWSNWSNPITCPNWFTKEEKIKHQLKDTDLGPVYGYQWRNFNKPYKPVPRNLDNIQPTFLNVAVLGNYKSNALKSTWMGMISRCYNIKDRNYHRYGGNNVYVANRWLTYEYFEEDCKHLPNWELKEKYPDEYTLDKDKSGGKCYGPNTCSWLSKKEQAIFRIDVKPVYALSPNNELFYYRSVKECAKQNNLDSTDIAHCLSNRRKSHRGWQFWREVKVEEKNEVIDQLGFIAKQLKSNPYDRRMVCSAWNPEQMKSMSLPACHYSFNLVAYNGKLNLICNMRSCDLMLGIPYNIASYGLLLTLLAKHANLELGELVISLADCHIYTNQIEGAKAQLLRNPLPLPEVVIPDNTEGRFDIFKWDHTQLELKNYQSHGKLNFALEV